MHFSYKQLIFVIAYKQVYIKIGVYMYIYIYNKR